MWNLLTANLASINLVYTKPPVDCIFVFRTHFDYINHLEFLDPKNPICVGVGTKLFVESMEETGNFANYGDHQREKFRASYKIELAT